MVLQLENITKYYGADLVFKNLNLKIEDNDRIGLIGVNGVGKTTLLNIIAEGLHFEEGELSIRNGVHIGFLKQNSGLVNEHTLHEEIQGVFADVNEALEGRQKLYDELAATQPGSERYEEISHTLAEYENLISARDAFTIDMRITKVLAGMGFADVDIKTKLVGTLSGGEKTRFALCKLLLQQPDLLILDEPTNHLDFSTLSWLEDYLLSYKGAILVVSHDRYFLDKLVTSVVEIEHNVATRYPGGYTAYLTLKEENFIRQQKMYDAQQKEIAKMQDYVDRNIVRATTSKMAKSRRKAIERLELVEKPLAPPKKAFIKFNYEQEPVKDLLTVENLKVEVGENPKNTLLENVDLKVFRGEKIAFIGENGIGKSSMFKVLLGNLPAGTGSIEWGRNAKIAYYDQDTGGLDHQTDVINEIWNRYPHLKEVEVRTLLGGVLFSGEDVYKSVAALSGGEKAKLKIADLTLKNSNVLMLDEPTNHLDLGTKEALDKALQKFTGTLLIISHDRYLLNKVPDKIIEIKDGKLHVYKGNYEEYLNQTQNLNTPPVAKPVQAENAKVEEADPPAPKTENTHYRSKKDRAQEILDKQEAARLEKEIALIMENIANLEVELAENASDYKKLEEISNSIVQQTALLEEMMENLEKLEHARNA